MLDLGPLTSDLAEMIDRVLRRGLKDLSAPLQQAYLELLLEQHGRLWDRSQLPPNTQRIAGWLEARWAGQIVPLLGLLGAIGDATIVREALDLGVVDLLARDGMSDPELYRWLLALLRLFDPRKATVLVESAGAPGLHHMFNLASLVCSLSRHFPSGRATRAALQPLVDGLMAATQGEPRHAAGGAAR